MGDIVVVIVSMVLMLQVVIFGAFLFFGAMASDDNQVGGRPSSYEPMAILTGRAAQRAAQQAALTERRAA